MIQLLINLILILVLILYPFVISKIISKKTKLPDKNNWKEILISILKISLCSIISLLTIGYLVILYNNLAPNSVAGLCLNTGGWTYSCTGDLQSSAKLLLPMEIVIIIHHFVSLSQINKIFKNSTNIFRYIFVFIYMIAIYFFSFFFLLNLYGLLTTIHFDSIFVEILRLITCISPAALFIVSIPIQYFISKRQ